jgi:hypothetical protein
MTDQPFVDQVEHGQAREWAMGHGSCDGPVERDDRVAGHLVQQLVQGEDLWPVGVVGLPRLVMNGRDGCLELVLADRPLYPLRA